MVMLLLTIAVSTLTFTGGRTNILQGAIHTGAVLRFPGPDLQYLSATIEERAHDLRLVCACAVRDASFDLVGTHARAKVRQGRFRSARTRRSHRIVLAAPAIAH